MQIPACGLDSLKTCLIQIMSTAEKGESRDDCVTHVQANLIEPGDNPVAFAILLSLPRSGLTMGLC